MKIFFGTVEPEVPSDNIEIEFCLFEENTIILEALDFLAVFFSRQLFVRSTVIRALHLFIRFCGNACIEY